jgi:uncharacterized hydrophobic protein (TIGR00271 family)
LDVAAEAQRSVAVDKKSLLEEGHRLLELHCSYDIDAELNEPFIVLTLGASLIATIGLIADNTAVVIGAMVVAPWIMPLRTTVFAILIGDWRLLRRSLRTLVVGVLITTVLSMLIGRVAHERSFINAAYGVFTNEITGRTQPTLLDLIVALVAGALATYAKLRERVVSSMAGTAIAVALVPPVCVMGLMASSGNLRNAAGAGLLFAANLLGILVGGIIVLTTMEPFFHDKLLRSRRTQLPLVIAVALLSAITIPLLKGTQARRNEVRKTMLTKRIQSTVSDFLKTKTLTFGGNESLELDNINYSWANGQKKSIVDIVVRVTDPETPTYKQIEAVEKEINDRIGNPLQGLRFKLRVKRINMSIVEGRDVMNTNTEALDPNVLEQDLNTVQEDLRLLEQMEIEDQVHQLGMPSFTGDEAPATPSSNPARP